MNYMVYAIPVFFILIILEWCVGKMQNKSFYRFNDTITNLNIGIGNQVFGLLFKVTFLAGLIWVYHRYAFFDQSGWTEWIFGLLLFDFLFYWAHRWGHTINIFWGSHIVHHQSEDFNFGVALRQSWFNSFIEAFVFLPLPLLGFDPTVILAIAGIDTLYQFWIHTEAIHKMPKWFEYIFNTPSHHRVHHGKNDSYIDKNYGGMLIIWDRLFGTFIDEAERPQYGIVSGLDSWNPLWANLHYYAHMRKMFKQSNGLSERFKVLFAKPSWLPEKMKEKQLDQLTTSVKNKSKYDISNPNMSTYIILQFSFIAIGLVGYLSYFTELSIFYKISFGLLILSSTIICGAILEKKDWHQYAEYGRLSIGIILLNSVYYQWYFNWFWIVLIGSSILFAITFIWYSYIMRLRLNTTKH